MSSIANMSVMLALDSKQFQKGLDAAAGSLKKFAAGFAAFFTIRGLTETIKQLENVGDAAASAGVSIEAFTRITGSLDAEDTMAATAALQKLGKVLSDVAAGDQAMAKKLQSLGFNPEQLVAAGLEGSLDVIAKKFVSTEDAIKRQGIAFGIWGKAASTVIPTLGELGRGVEGVANKFGGVMTEADLERVSRAKDALTSVDNALAGMKNRLAIELSPIVEEIVKGFGLMADALDDLAGKGGPKLTLGEKVTLGISSLLAAMGEGTGILEKGTLQNVVEDFANDKQIKQKRFFDLMNAKASEKKVALNDMRLAKLFGSGTTEERVESVNKWLGELAKGAENFAKNLRHARADKAMQLFEETRTPLEKFREEVEDLKGRAGDLKKGVLNRKLGQLFLDLEKNSGILENLSMTSRTMQRGSAEEGSFMAQFEQRAEVSSRGIQERIAATMDAIKQMESRQVALQEQIAASLRKPGNSGMGMMSALIN